MFFLFGTERDQSKNIKINNLTTFMDHRIVQFKLTSAGLHCAPFSAEPLKKYPTPPFPSWNLCGFFSHREAIMIIKIIRATLFLIYEVLFYRISISWWCENSVIQMYIEFGISIFSWASGILLYNTLLWGWTAAAQWFCPTVGYVSVLSTFKVGWAELWCLVG